MSPTILKGKFNINPSWCGLFGQLRMRGGSKMTHWEIAVSGCSNFHSSSTNITSYESWHFQLKFETSVRSLKLIVWPQEVSEVTEVKIKKILGENPKITNFCLTEMLYTSKESLQKSTFIFVIKLEVFVTKKWKKNWFCDFRSQKILIFYQSRLNFWKTCQDSQKITLLPSSRHVYG